MPDGSLRPVTIYLSQQEIEALDQEASDEGRSGLSAQVRWILAQRRRTKTA